MVHKTSQPSYNKFFNDSPTIIILSRTFFLQWEKNILRVEASLLGYVSFMFSLLVLCFWSGEMYSDATPRSGVLCISDVKSTNYKTCGSECVDEVAMEVVNLVE